MPSGRLWPGCSRKSSAVDAQLAGKLKETLLSLSDSCSDSKHLKMDDIFWPLFPIRAPQKMAA